MTNACAVTAIRNGTTGTRNSPRVETDGEFIQGDAQTEEQRSQTANGRELTHAVAVVIVVDSHVQAESDQDGDRDVLSRCAENVAQGCTQQ